MPRTEPHQVVPGSRGSVVMDGRRYELDQATCARCGTPVLIASGHGRSALYTSISLQSTGPTVIGFRHRCPRKAPETAPDRPTGR